LWQVPFDVWVRAAKGAATGTKRIQERTMRFIDLLSFSVKHLFDGDSSVVAWIGISWRWKASGRVFSCSVALHLWEFDIAGKVSRFFHVEDTHAMWLATRADA
jgi:hypothetical protein